MTRKQLLRKVKARLVEGSTWSGLCGLLLANTMLMGERFVPYLGGAAIVCAVIAILLKDPAQNENE